MTNTSNSEINSRTNGTGVQLEDNVQSKSRVVMRRQISLSLSDIQAASEGFDPRPATIDGNLRLSKRPFLSIIIPNYNGRQFLPALMTALDQQTFHDFEIIVVDDASSDDSVHWLEETHANSRVISNRHNLGFAKSCNIAADVARGRAIVFLNSDTQPEPQWLSELARAICECPQAGMYASKVLLYDRPTDLHTTGDMLGKNGIPINRGVWERDMGQYDDHLEVFGGSGCAVAYLKDLWDALGGFDEDYWMYLEDVDFAFRAQLMGARGIFVPKARVLHHLTATAGGTLSSYYVGRNTVWLIAKNMPASILKQNAKRIIAAQTRLAIDALRNIRGSEARARLQGLVVGVLTIGKMVAKRRVIQRCRTVDDASIMKQLYG